MHMEHTSRPFFFYELLQLNDYYIIVLISKQVSYIIIPPKKQSKTNKKGNRQKNHKALIFFFSFSFFHQDHPWALHVFVFMSDTVYLTQLIARQHNKKIIQIVKIILYFCSLRI